MTLDIFFLYVERDYKKLLDFADKYISEHKLINLDSADLVNDAILMVSEHNTEYDIVSLKKKIKGLARQEKTYESSRFDYDKRPPAYKGSFGEKTLPCNRCRNEIPSSGFRIRNNYKDGTKNVSTICKECESKITAKWVIENREKWNAYMRQRRPKKNKQPQDINVLWNKANKKRYEKERETLCDTYIRRLLANKKDITPEMIVKKRNQILLDRQKQSLLAPI